MRDTLTPEDIYLAGTYLRSNDFSRYYEIIGPWRYITALDAAIDFCSNDRTMTREMWLRTYRAFREEWRKQPVIYAEVGSIYGTRIFRSGE